MPLPRPVYASAVWCAGLAWLGTAACSPAGHGPAAAGLAWAEDDVELRWSGQALDTARQACLRRALSPLLMPAREGRLQQHKVRLHAGHPLIGSAQRAPVVVMSTGTGEQAAIGWLSLAEGAPGALLWHRAAWDHYALFELPAGVWPTLKACLSSP